MWKDFFYFTRSERRGIMVLIILIVIVITIGVLFSKYQEKKEIADTIFFQKEYDDFHISLHERIQKPVSHSLKEQKEIVLTPFDPNTADSVTFFRLGLSSRTVSNIFRYRAKGGVFKKPDDFKKIYGLTPEQYAELFPYILIKKSSDKKKANTFIAKQVEKPFSTVYKYPKGTVIDLNQADTIELKKIPGIGKGIAKAIVNYRKRLGGFYSVNQLEDIHLSTTQFAEWFHVEDNNTIRINLNKVNIEHLRAHPYFNYYQAKVIVEYRQKKELLKSLKQLTLYEEFTEKDFERMEHYACFE
jgi:DNA uptake protein ComE-like DNA-binding protein